MASRRHCDPVLAPEEAIHATVPAPLDCFVASLLAMTGVGRSEIASLRLQ